MGNIAIIYFSGSGHAHLMAEAIADGANQVAGTHVDLLRITGEQIVNGRWKDDTFMAKLNAADGIIFGSPTYMGGVAAQFKAFVDAASGVWFQQTWKDKLAAGFTHSGSLSGDKQGTLLYLAINAAQHNMIWITHGEMANPENGINRLGSYLGVMGQSNLDMSGKPPEIDSGDALTSQRLGMRMAKMVNQFQG
jgi:NAD(P)H dehydrogenase (quinone)